MVKFLVDLAVDAVGVGDREAAKSGFPPGGDLSLDEPALGFALPLADAAFGGPGPGTFVLDISDREPQQLDHRVVVREMPTILDDLPELIVQALDAYLELGSEDDR